ALARHTALRDGALRKLADLQRFRDEYFDQRARALTDGVAAARVRDYDQFIARIGDAIDQQRAELVRLEATRAQALAQWQALERRRKAFDVLAARHAETERLREGRAERKVEDEHAARIARDRGR
ncbi:MAG: flagellar export protein FliJ, partial [Burkholderiales bacterium]|nr:flagellar export protein FliJ [Burkholderiales bacterium]